jgi:hypothetical protein
MAMAIGYTLGGWFVHSARSRITANTYQRVTISMAGNGGLRRETHRESALASLITPKR